MVKDTTVATPQTDEEVWEDVSVGLGTEHNPEEKGPLVGIYQRTDQVDVTDKQTNEVRPTNAHIFDINGEQMFVWGSYNLDLAIQEISTGQKVRIEFKGRNNFTGDNGPQQVKNYRVQVASLKN